MKNLSPIEKLIKSETYAAMSNVLYQQLGKFGDNLSEKIKDDIREQAEHYQRESEEFIKKAAKQIEK
jgi:hypothetical protein